MIREVLLLRVVLVFQSVAYAVGYIDQVTRMDLKRGILSGNNGRKDCNNTLKKMMTIVETLIIMVMMVMKTINLS